jgi:hypothetical protein
MTQRHVFMDETVSLSLGKYLADSAGLSKVLEAIDALADEPRPADSVPWGFCDQAAPHRPLPGAV